MHWLKECCVALAYSIPNLIKWHAMKRIIRIVHVWTFFPMIVPIAHIALVKIQ